MPATNADDGFVGRTDEQRRFAALLGSLAGPPTGPDHAYVVLVYASGGMGKTRLLRRFQFAAHQNRVGRWWGKPRHVSVTYVNWESDRDVHLPDYAEGSGPPIWIVLSRLARFMRNGENEPRRKKRIDAAFAEFRERTAHSAELERRARELGLAAVAGRHPLLAEEIQPFLALGTAALNAAGAPVPGLSAALSGVAAGAHEVSSRLQERRFGRIDPKAFDDLIGDIDGAVTAFGDGLRKLSHHQPVVVLFDTAELLGPISPWLSRIADRAGERVALVLGMRLEQESGPIASDEMARYRASVDERRLIAMPLAKFDDSSLVEYVARRVGPDVASNLDVDDLRRVTRGIPLAAQLLCDLVTNGGRAGDAITALTGPEHERDVVRGVARRYLVHASTLPGLRPDLPLIFGLALLLSSEPDADLTAALLDIDESRLSDVLTDLAMRHDFILSTSRTMHQEVQEIIQSYLLDPLERSSVREANVRAKAALRTRVAALGVDNLEGALRDRRWQEASLGLLWHQLWTGNGGGLAMLREGLPAATVLAPELAVQMVNLTAYFHQTFSPEEDQLFRRLLTIAPARSLRDFNSERSSPAAMPNAASGSPTGQAPMPVKIEALSAGGPLLADASMLPESVPPELRVAVVEGAWAMGLHPFGSPSIEERLEHLERAVALAAKFPECEILHDMLALGAERLAQSALSSGLSEPTARLALRAADLALLNRPASLDALRCRGVALRELRDLDGALDVFRGALEIDSQRRSIWFDLAMTLAMKGDREGAVTAYRRAADVVGGDRVAPLVNSGPLLRSLGRTDEAEQGLREAAELDPNNVSVRINLAEQLLHLGRLPDAEALLLGVVGRDPASTLPVGVLLGLIVRQRSEAEAQAWFRMAADGRGTKQSAFEEREFRAIALAAIGEVVAGVQLLRESVTLRRGDDLYEPAIYALLATPELPGLSELQEIWREILAADPNAICRCEGCRAASV
jgi:tetratricopeptide (TPR) repeat protein